MKKKWIGFWEIKNMMSYDKNDSDEEDIAYIEIDKYGMGDFKIEFVSGSIDGNFLKNRFEFIWNGTDEYGDTFGIGWFELKEEELIVGEIKFYNDAKLVIEAEKGLEIYR